MTRTTLSIVTAAALGACLGACGDNDQLDTGIERHPDVFERIADTAISVGNHDIYLELARSNDGGLAALQYDWAGEDAGLLVVDVATGEVLEHWSDLAVDLSSLGVDPTDGTSRDWSCAQQVADACIAGFPCQGTVCDSVEASCAALVNVGCARLSE